ncbi:hypothetical protein C6A85_14940, partial [Mycobacterium sp. ITM-2017-0098]
RQIVVGAHKARRSAVGQLVVGDAEVRRIAERETDHPDEEGNEAVAGTKSVDDALAAAQAEAERIQG